MNLNYSHIIEKLATTTRRVVDSGALFVALFVLAVTVLFATRTDVLQIGAATATLPQQTEAKATETSPDARFAARVGITHQAIDLEAGTIDARKVTPLPVDKLSSVDVETLWLARCIYSETKRPEEMELVAWAIRNRVETSYRGKSTYRDVVLDPWQFSAFNHNSGKRGYFTGLTAQSDAKHWQHALTIAHVVKNAPASLRPFSEQTRHYYSERSMVGGRQPNWAKGQQKVAPNRPFQLEANRFRFYENVA